MQKQIQKFNEKLVNENIEVNIRDYVIELNENFFNIDISFIDDFMNLVTKEYPCIEHKLLQKCGAIQLTSGSNDFKKILERYKAHDGLDYTVRNLSDRDDYSHKIEYILHPPLFTKILIRSQNTLNALNALNSSCCGKYNVSLLAW